MSNVKQIKLEDLNLIGNQILVRPYIPNVNDKAKGVLLSEGAKQEMREEFQKSETFKINAVPVVKVGPDVKNLDVKEGTIVIIPMDRIVHASRVYLNPQDNEDYLVVIPFTDSFVVGYYNQ
jgi:hypothetical protein